MKRHTAYKLTIPHILNFPILKDEVGKHLLSPEGKKIRRVHTCGRVARVFLDTEQQLGFFDVEDIDDSGAKVSVRFFGDSIVRAMGVQEGDIVRVVGKPRVYKEERFIQGEVLHPISILEVELTRAEAVIPFGEPPAVSIKDEHSQNIEKKSEELSEDEQKVLEFIKKHQSEEGGVRYLALIKELGFEGDEDTFDEILSSLMEKGEIYEPKIGRFKTVE